jgi:hypothetical protein
VVEKLMTERQIQAAYEAFRKEMGRRVLWTFREQDAIRAALQAAEDAE